jgi:hypothetical protein
MPVAGGGFEQCYDVQAAVTAGSLLVVAADVSQAANDKQQLQPLLDRVTELPDELGELQSDRLLRRETEGLMAGIIGASR